MKTGELSARLGIHPNTIRVWCKSYSPYLSKGAVGRAAGVNRELSERDCLVLATIADMRNNGLPHEAIVASLQNDNLITSLPELPTAAEQETRQNIALVPVAELNRALDRVRTLEQERDRLISERDAAQLDTKEANARIAVLEREIGTALGQLTAINRNDWWLKWLAVAVLVLGAVVIAALVLSVVIRGG